MDHLWAPWRGQYVGAEKKDNEKCIFCFSEDLNGADKNKLILYRDSLALVMMNLYPYNNGHLLVVPRRHINKLELATTEELAKIMSLCSLATQSLSKVLNAQGFNVGLNLGVAAGAGIAAHLHFHIVPRWQGDVNFMATIAETKVISEHLKTTYNKLEPYFKK